MKGEIEAAIITNCNPNENPNEYTNTNVYAKFIGYFLTFKALL